jgi:hypothetical protein
LTLCSFAAVTPPSLFLLVLSVRSSGLHRRRALSATCFTIETEAMTASVRSQGANKLPSDICV